MNVLNTECLVILARSWDELQGVLNWKCLSDDTITITIAGRPKLEMFRDDTTEKRFEADSKS